MGSGRAPAAVIKEKGDRLAVLRSTSAANIITLKPLIGKEVLGVWVKGVVFFWGGGPHTAMLRGS